MTDGGAYQALPNGGPCRTEATRVPYIADYWKIASRSSNGGSNGVLIVVSLARDRGVAVLLRLTRAGIFALDEARAVAASIGPTYCSARLSQ